VCVCVCVCVCARARKCMLVQRTISRAVWWQLPDDGTYNVPTHTNVCRTYCVYVKLAMQINFYTMHGTYNVKNIHIYLDAELEYT
jgi:hypothetical protein